MNISGFISTSVILVIAALSQTVLATSREADPRAALAAQSRTFMDALSRGDAAAAAELFTTDAQVIIPTIAQPLSGRERIAGFWKSAVDGGLKNLELTTRDLDGEGALRFETGTYRA